MIKRNIVLLCAIACLQGMVFYAPVATLYRQAVGISVFEITLIESISMALMLLLEIPWGWLADWIGYRRTMLICCGLFWVSKLIFWRAASFGDFLLERVLLSVVCAGLSGVDNSMLYLSCGEENPHWVFSIHQSLQRGGLLLAAGVCALWIGTDYPLAGFFTVISYGVAALLALGLQEVKPVSEKTRVSIRDSFRVLGEQLRRKKLLLLLISVALLQETHQTITVFLNQLQYVRAGMDARLIAVAFIAVSLFGLIGGLSAALCRRLGATRMGVGLFGCAAGCCLLLAVTQSALLSVLGILGLTGCFHLLEPLQLKLQNEQIRSPNRATALSMNAVVLESIGIGSNLIYGRLAEQSLPWTMALGAAACLLGGILFLASQRKME